MKHRKLLFALLSGLLAVSAISCDSDNDTEEGPSVVQSEQFKSVKSALSRETPAVDDAQLSAFVEDQYDLNLAILREPSSKVEHQNAMISTFSIQPALAMTWAGAAGNTADEMKTALRLGDDAHKMLNHLDALVISKHKEAVNSDFESADAVEIQTDNNLYLAPAEKWNDQWLDTLAKNYGAGIWSTNFAADPEKARKYINDEVSKSTHDKIKDLLPEGSVTGLTRAVITNAVYFKSPWSTPFNVTNELIDFVKIDNSSVKVDYLANTESFGYSKTEEYTAISIPLRDREFEMLFVMPENGKYDSVLTSLTGSEMNKIIGGLNSTRIELKIPSFKFTTTVNLSDPLKALGMKDAFDEGKADFSGMTGENVGLYISDVFHKTFIGVDEKGVEAAAATAVLVGKNSIDFEEPPKVTIDHPSIFVVYEKKTHTPLFFGQLMDPSAE